MRTLSLLAVLAAVACGGDDDATDGGLPDAHDDGVIAAACGDGLDNDGDGQTDFPADPGCVAPEDPDETDPMVPAQCANGMDDDGDGQTDFPDDPGCDSASDDDETEPLALPCDDVTDITASGMASGSITGGPDDLFSPLCAGHGDERVYSYTVTTGPATLVVSTEDPATTLDTVVYVRTTCLSDTTELGCNDDAPGVTGGPSSLSLPAVANGTYFIIVDAYGAASLGDYVLTVTAM